MVIKDHNSAELFVGIQQKSKLLARLLENEENFSHVIEEIKAWDARQFRLGSLPQLPAGLSGEEFLIVKCELVDTVECIRQSLPQLRQIEIGSAQWRSAAQMLAYLWGNKALIERLAESIENDETETTRILVGQVALRNDPGPTPDWLLDLLFPLVCWTVKDWQRQEIKRLYGSR